MSLNAYQKLGISDEQFGEICTDLDPFLINKLFELNKQNTSSQLCDALLYDIPFLNEIIEIIKNKVVNELGITLDTDEYISRNQLQSIFSHIVLTLNERNIFLNNLVKAFKDFTTMEKSLKPSFLGDSDVEELVAYFSNLIIIILPVKELIHKRLDLYKLYQQYIPDIINYFEAKGEIMNNEGAEKVLQFIIFKLTQNIIIDDLHNCTIKDRLTQLHLFAENSKIYINGSAVLYQNMNRITNSVINSGYEVANVMRSVGSMHGSIAIQQSVTGQLNADLSTVNRRTSTSVRWTARISQGAVGGLTQMKDDIVSKLTS